MNSADSYRMRAAELRARARRVPTDRAADLDKLARCYLRLAEQAQRYSPVDVVVELGRKVLPDTDKT